ELNLTNEADTEVLVEDKGSGEKGSSTANQVSTDRPEVSTATPSTPLTTTTIFGNEDLTIAQTLIKLRSDKAKEKGVAFRDVEEPPRLTRSTITLQPLPTIHPKYKGKGVLVKEEPKKLEKVKRRDRGKKQEEATIAALTEEFDEIQARMDADHELAEKETIGSRKSRGNTEKTTYKNSSQEHDDYSSQTYGLVMKRSEDNTLEGFNLLLLGDLKVMFKPNAEDEIWNNQQDWNLISWKLYENCGVHTLLIDGTLNRFNLLVEKRYSLIKEMLEKMLNWKLEAEAESTMTFELLKFIKSQVKE
nr:hypothetical protein [Tanacetum cinerariifolium]